MKHNKTITQLISKINRRMLKNNTQRVLFSLLTSKEDWVSRSSLRVPSASARLRDLRKPEFGAFDVQCVSATELNRPSRSRGNHRPTFYRLNPRTVTVARVTAVFEGVIANQTK